MVASHGAASAAPKEKVDADAGTAKRRRQQRTRSTASKVAWLTGLLQASRSHHTSMDLPPEVTQLLGMVKALVHRVEALEDARKPEPPGNATATSNEGARALPVCKMQRAPAAKSQADDVNMHQPKADDGEEPVQPQADDGGKLSAADVPVTLQQEDAMVGVSQQSIPALLPWPPQQMHPAGILTPNMNT